MEDLIAINLGIFLPTSIKLKLRRKVKKIKNIIRNYDLIGFDNQFLEDEFSSNNFECRVKIGGKDVFYLIDFYIDDFHFVMKISRWTLNQLSYYLVSIRDFQQKITDTIEISSKGLLKIEIANTLAFTRFAIKNRLVTVIIQEYSEAIDYVEFTRHVAKSKIKIPENLVKTTWKFLHENGFTIDYMPKNFHITFNHEKNIYRIEYLDFIYSNDPTIKEEARLIAKEIAKGKYRKEYFEIL